jgi:hypothetical protein
MKRLLVTLIPLVLVAACDDPDQTRATPNSEAQTETEAPVGDERPDAINRSETAEDLGEASDQSLTSAVETNAESDPAYVGIWAANQEWCENTNGAEVPIEITRTTFGGYENQCQIAELTPKGEDEWDATLECLSEGTTETRDVTMAAQENTLHITYHDIDDQGISYHRCVPAE